MNGRSTWTTCRAILLTGLLMALVGPISGQPAPVQMAESMVDAMARGDFQAAVADFDEAMKGALPADKLKQVWGTLGTFTSRIGTRETQEAGHRMVYVTCQFAQGNLDVKVVVNTDGRIGGLWFTPTAAQAAAAYSPPAYVQTARFKEHNVTVGAGDAKLPGTLTAPVGKGPFPAVVLVHGSGPQDRDQSLGPNKPFRDIAWGLASRGIAVLRYDKRTFDPQGKAQLAKVAHTLTVKEEVIDDALAAVRLLRSTPNIDPKRVFVLGHSLGGVLVPRIGKADPRIAGLILLAGCGTEPMEAVVRRQLTYIASLNGPITPEVQRAIAEQEAAIFRNVPASYHDDLRVYIPQSAAMARSLAAPMLILHGGRDYQATTEEFNAWKQVLSAKRNATFKLYPDLNHLFMTGVGMATPGEYLKAGHVAETVVRDIAGWIIAGARMGTAPR